MNAVAAMEPGGRLEVVVEDLSGTIQIRVRDSGCGIEADHLDKIFDPYFTTRAKGTGLGLSIVHRIVENLKGEIGVESLPGQGTCFTLSLAGAALVEAQVATQAGIGNETGNETEDETEDGAGNATGPENS